MSTCQLLYVIIDVVATVWRCVMRMGGVTEVAELIGVSRQRLSKLRERPDFPDPIGELAQGPIWDLEQVEAWSGSGLRRSASGRPPSKVASRTLGGRFLLEEAIGKGGFANVYRAIDKKRPTYPVAVKVLRDVDQVPVETIRRFRRELRLLQDLKHENVIPILGQGETDDEGIWYAMPLAQGSLHDLLSEIADDQPEILDLLRQVCAGLSYVHAQGIYHRDLKPGNILLTMDNTWAISDFGLAVEIERQTTVLTSSDRSGLGSWCYTAPEQWKAARAADRRSDIFGLGKVLQELLTGEVPMGNEMPASPLRPVIEKAISDQPDARHQTVEEFYAAVELAIGQPNVKWESPDDTAQRLLERVRLPKASVDDLGELLAWALELDEAEDEDMVALSRVLPWISVRSVRKLWDLDSDGFARVYERYAAHVQSAGFSFEYCDVLADFGRRVVEQTNDRRILRATTRSLAELGHRHNRWHVRSTLTAILQAIRETAAAVAAAEGLRSASVRAVEWSLNDFSMRSLHPSLRTAISDYVTNSGAS